MSTTNARHLKILMLTWEYPPRIIGGISRVVEGLSRALATVGHEVHVVTPEMPGSPLEDNDQGVFIHRVRIESPTPTFHSWVLMMNHYLTKRVGRLINEIGSFDIVHVHDWLVLPSGAETKAFCNSTMVSTLHSLECKRSGGVNTAESKMVDSLEWWITFESALVIVCSKSMQNDTVKEFGVPEDKIWIIPIGVDPEKFRRCHPDRDLVRAKYGANKGDKLILFVGRLTQQKGCEYLIRAIPQISKQFNTKLIVVGDGSYREELESIAKASDDHKIRFTGFLPDNELTELFVCADLMVIPSVYEPFGVVALEAMAAGLPVVASNVDGLGEIVVHERNGILVFPKDSSSIAWGISRILSDSANTQRLIVNANNDIRTRFSWDAVANLTLDLYHRALLMGSEGKR
ncbi:MAG TPA: glycosyltransferase family 4 protein [Nitrososphaerales archaeon]|nr:glycosyltransferase family 4 protein [Nitrososphaerales archaeon]